MTISTRCAICKSADRRKLVELGWNDGMSCPDISNGLGGDPGPSAILKHLKEHTEDGNARNIPVEPSLPMRERVYDIQKLQVDEIERRLKLAQQRAAAINKEHEGEEDWKPLDYSDFFDILGKDMQAAVSSIIKTQALSDKRDKATGDLKLGLFEAMTNAGLSPLALVGGKEPKALPPGEEPISDD